MSRIVESSIERLKQQINILDVVESFIEIKKRGANHKACCPFHGEKTPSFTINPSKQIFNCFGCGAKGDAIKFVMDYEKVSYPEAIEKIAAITNFSLDYEDKNYEPKKPVVVVTPKVKEEKKSKKIYPIIKKRCGFEKGL